MAEESAGPTAKEEKSALSPRLIGAGIAIVVAVVFVFQNRDETDIRFLIPKVHVHIWAALLVSLALGILIGYFGGRHTRKK